MGAKWPAPYSNDPDPTKSNRHSLAHNPTPDAIYLIPPCSETRKAVIYLDLKQVYLNDFTRFGFESSIGFDFMDASVFAACQLIGGSRANRTIQKM